MYVFYQIVELVDLTFIDVFFNLDNFVWDYQNEIRFSIEFLYQENRVSFNDKLDRNIVFIVLIYFIFLLFCCYYCVMVWDKSFQSENF